jgi:hypothetical protein
MRKSLITALALAVPLTPLFAQSMPVSQFLAKAEALKEKGAMALFSGDVAKLKAEVVNSGKELRTEQVAARKAGRKPATCMPEQGKASVGSNEVLAHFRSIPPAQRSMTVKAAFAGLMRKKYPC